MIEPIDYPPRPRPKYRAIIVTDLGRVIHIPQPKSDDAVMIQLLSEDKFEKQENNNG